MTGEQLGMSFHSPGPWRVELETDSFGEEVVRVLASTGETVCDNVPYYPCPVNRGDALLIAVAPEFLSLAKDAAKLLRSIEGAEDIRALRLFIDHAEFLVRKAEGCA